MHLSMQPTAEAWRTNALQEQLLRMAAVPRSDAPKLTVFGMQPGVASVHCAILQKTPTGVSLFLRPAASTLVGRSFR